MRTLYVRFPEKWPESGTPQIEWTIAGGKSAPESGKSSSTATLPKAPRTFAVLPYQAVSITEMELPPGRYDLLQKAAMNALEDVSISTAGSAHVAVGRETSKGKRAVTIADRGLMRAVIKSLSTGGRKLDGVIIDAMACPLEQDVFSVIWNGSGGFLRVSGEMGFLLDSTDGTEPPASLTRALELYAGVMPPRVDLYIESGAEPPPLADWGEKLGLPLRVAEEWDWRESVATSPGGSLNLMQGEFAPPSALESMYPRIIVFSALIAGLIVAWTGGAVAEWRAVKREESVLRASIKDIFTSAFPKAGPALDPPAQMKKAIAAFKWRSNIWSEGGFIQLAARAEECIGPGYIVSMEYADRKLEIVAVMSEDGEVKKALAKLTDLGLAGTVKETSKADGGVRAKLVIGMAALKELKDGNIRANKEPSSP